MHESEISKGRRRILKAAGVGAALSATGILGAPVYAQNKPLRLGIIAPRSGVAGTAGECGIRAVQWGVERLNAASGIGGRKVELVIQEETTPKETLDRFRKLVLQDKVDAVHGVISSGVSLALGPGAEESKTLTLLWDGTTQDGVKEMMPSPRYLFKAADNEVDAVMASLLAIKHYKGKFARIAGINADYTYGRNTWTTFQALLKKYGIEYTVVSEQWIKVGTMDLTSNVAALKAAKPDLVFSSMLFADLPIFMKQAHNAGLTESSKFVIPAAGWQQSALKKEFTPEGIVYGHSTYYFDHPQASKLSKEFSAWYKAKFNDYPHFEAERAFFCLQIYKAGVEKALAAKSGAWPSSLEIAAAIPGTKVESLGGMGYMRTDHIPNQMFTQGLSTHKNNYDFVTLSSLDTMSSEQIQKPAGADFWEWLQRTDFKI
jgi:branched-chain amino acid transport system substrate-binding protein